MTRARSQRVKRRPVEEVRERPLGRPPRIDRQAIAHAALEVGLERLTMRRVAERLGVRAATLYHHVRSKRELLRLAGESSIRSMEIPPDDGRHWSAWLRAYARAGRATLLARPALLQQIALGTLGLDRVVDAVETALAVLERHGFSAREAVEAFVSISQCAIGAAIYEMRERNAREGAGEDPLREELLRAVTLRRPEELERVRRLLRRTPSSLDYERFFERQLHALLVGLAEARGEDWRGFLAAAPD
jgi:AcrR family transcriptional regulator